MKQRFSSLDVKVIASELSKTLCSLRLANIYDLSSRLLLFKFAKPDHREQIIVDPGFRCHLTSFSRATAAAPSHFVAKLRKYLRTRRVTSVSQIGTDRVIEFQFGDGHYRLFLEFYAGGNIVLTDREFTIISLLRNVPEGPGQEALRTGLKYILENRQNYGGVPDTTTSRVQTALQKALDKAGGDAAPRKKKGKPGDVLRKALAGSMSEFPPMLIDHALRSTRFDVNKPISDLLNDEDLLNKVVVALQEAQRIDRSIVATELTRGYIFAKVRDGEGYPPSKGQDKGPSWNAEQITPTVIYEDFQPFRPLQMEEPVWEIIEFESFNKTVDEFFSSIEGQRLESRLTEREQNAKRKLDNARHDHEKRVGGLQQVQELNIRRAQAIEANLQRVQEAIAAVNGLVGQGMDWVEIARLIEMEQARHNAVAEMIQLPLKLYENTVTLLLAEEDFADEDGMDNSVTDDSASESEGEHEGTSAKLKPMQAAAKLAVDVDLALSPWSNARQYYDQKKTAAVKEQKTIQSSAKALKSTEKKISADLKKGLSQEKQVLRPVRKQLWFEKFHFFISSEGYLVLSGKDAQQNEILYKRYLMKGDIYVNADLQGAASIVVKNKPARLNDPVPPSTLSQAGSFAVATSSAWDSKAVMSAWWVHPEQVSKTTPTGEYLTAGSFAITGEKNYLPPAHLLLGFGVLFRVSEESMTKHLKHRLRDEGVNGDTIQELKENVDLSDGNTVEHDETQEDFRDSVQQIDEQAEGHLSGSSSADDDHCSISHASSVEDHNPLLPRVSAHENMKGHTNERCNSQSSVEDNEFAANAGSPNEVDSQSMAEAAPSCTSNSTGVAGIHHLSARDRRLLRKGHSPVRPAEDVSDPVEGSVTSAEPASAKPSPDEKHRSMPQRPQVRGKHGKLNKLKTKYADQDAEDRALALRLLGSAATHKTTEDAATKVAKEEESAAQKQRRRQQHIIATDKGKEEEDIRRLKLAEGSETLDPAEAEVLEDLEAYVGTPLAGDEILDALVVCGPWDAIGGRCRWRAKIQPGSTKKGKAVRDVLTTWAKVVETSEKKKRPGDGDGGGNEAMMEEENLRRREGEILRGLREQEVIGVVPVGKVRVVMGVEGSGAKGKGGGALGKGKRGGRGSKRQK
ncbi:MAG: hypothetical protein LQ341_000722 [Variospora aurantia]|nr:MAG: hypothetical protein LQ341_000722 [Variospora aurantia]